MRVLGHADAARAGGGQARHRLRLRGHAPVRRRDACLAHAVRRLDLSGLGCRTTPTLLLRRFNLHAEQPIKALSHGERVKATLLLVLARRPRLLLLDEPTTGLDPVARHEILAELMDVRAATSAARSCSRRTTRRTSSRSPIRSRSSIAAGSSTRATRKRSSIAGAALHLDVPPASTLPTLPGVIDTHDERPHRGRHDQGLLAGRSTRVYERAGATVPRRAAHDARGDLRRQRDEQPAGGGGMNGSIVRRLVLKDLYLMRWIDRRRRSSPAASRSRMMPLGPRLGLRRRRLAHLHPRHPEHLPRDDRRRAGEEGQGSAVHPEPAGLDDAVHRRQDERRTPIAFIGAVARS